MDAAPPTSVKAGRLKLAGSWVRQPPPHVRCAKSGKKKSARAAVARHEAARRQRSAPAEMAGIAARPAAKMRKQSLSARPSEKGSGESKWISWAKNGPRPSQSQCAPAAVKEWAEPGVPMAKENPTATVRIAAMAKAQRVASIACAAERERPRP